LFQTEPIIWLQSLASPALTRLMTGVTTLGYTPVYIVLVLTLAFGVRLRPTLVVLVAILLSGVLTASLKDGLAFPRPSSIDVRVGEPGDPSPPLDVVDRGGAPDFWSLPTDEARAAFREREPDSYGFPSGHVSTATAFLVALALAFRRKSLLGFAAFWVPLMALSRMYFGRHFLADVLGGAAVGLVGVLAALLLLRSFEQDTSPRPRAIHLVPLSATAVVLVVLAALVPALDAENIGRLVGVVATYGLLTATGFPRDDGSLWRRAGRVLGGILLFASATLVVGFALEVGGLEDTRTGTLVGSGLGTAAALGGAIAASRGLRLYAPAPSGARGTS
jgi:membrane-associated phospholipid phosphatase